MSVGPELSDLFPAVDCVRLIYSNKNVFLSRYVYASKECRCYYKRHIRGLIKISGTHKKQ